MIKKPHPCLWFNGNAFEAANFYCSLFSKARILSTNNLATLIDLDGSNIMCLNGGPQYKATPAVSQFVTSEDEIEVKHLWANLSKDGKVMMNLDKYDWSELYGFCEDRFGISWQIFKGKMSDVNQKVVTCLTFVGKDFGKAERAIQFYTSVISNSSVEGISKYSGTQSPMDGAVMHAQFRLNNSVFMAMDGFGNHQFTFSPGTSIVIECETQDEIDYYWSRLGESGAYSRCGWLDDQFGVSWQVVPAVLSELLNDPERAPRVVNAFMKMTKFEIAKLLNA